MLSILVLPNNSWTARRLLVFLWIWVTFVRLIEWRAIGADRQANECHPFTDNTRVLARRNVQALMKATWLKILGAYHERLPHPPFEQCPRTF